MELAELGFDSVLAEQATCCLGQLLARVTAVDRSRYVVRNEAGEMPAELTGKFQHAAASSVDTPCVGDWVCVRVGRNPFGDGTAPMVGFRIRGRNCKPAAVFFNNNREPQFLSAGINFLTILVAPLKCATLPGR